MSDADYLRRVVVELASQPAESSWFEFKLNDADPEVIGGNISALSNSAILEKRDRAWLIWGVRDESREIVGTTFSPESAMVGNQNLDHWLVQRLAPHPEIRFESVEVKGNKVVVLELLPAAGQPTRFKNEEFVRVGSNTRNLRELPEWERAIWEQLNRTPFEKRLSLVDVSPARVLEVLDHEAFFRILRISPPSSDFRILDALEADELVRRNEGGHWGVTNLGAVLFARDLRGFGPLSRKAVRVISYPDKSRVRTEREHLDFRGYAVSFDAVISYIMTIMPRNEVIRRSIREDVTMYPEIAVRELVANTIIHQDFIVSGAGPMIEVFVNRVEFTNPGAPLGEVSRLLDQAPRSRNEAMASLMRRIGLCEERGSGIDKVVAHTEFHQLPPPRWEVSGNFSKATLFSYRSFREMDRAERVHACYLHACLRHVSNEPMTNATLRERFGLEDRRIAQVSRVIRDAVDDRAIKPYDEAQGRKTARYLPAWA